MSGRIRQQILLGLGPLVIAGAGIWLYLHGGRYVETNNAYLKADKVSVSSEISGKVVSVLTRDNRRVEKGQSLFQVDDQHYQIALSKAQAHLMKVGGDIESLRADFMNRQADLDAAQTDLDYYYQEYLRLNRLLEISAVSSSQVDQAEYYYQHASQQVEVNRQALKVARALLIDPELAVEEHPDYLLAQAELEQARLDLKHVETLAPNSGIVANFDMQPGEYVVAGAPLFAIVDDGSVWVDANFKETDLTYLRTGQVARVKVDAYPDFQWQGKVASITPGTGSEFSLLPSQNSSGNWVKVVQRVTVKIELVNQHDAPMLTSGMSADVSVDTGHIRHLPWNN